MIEGIVIKAYSGFYYVQANNKLWECSLRGRFKKVKKNVFAGDTVRIKTIDEKTGVIEEILPRTNILIRPAIANVEQVLIVFAARNPDPDPGLLDRILVQAQFNGIKPAICFNKVDLVDLDKIKELADSYAQAGFTTIICSAKSGQEVASVREVLADKITVLAGPSGAGKSTLLNEIQPGLGLKTGEVSSKIGRGKHTTRHVELLSLDFGGLVADTPGFSTMYLPEMEKEDLMELFPEMEIYFDKCKFTGCLHDKEPQCAVKEAVSEGLIAEFRYNHYLEFLKEVREKERRY